MLYSNKEMRGPTDRRGYGALKNNVDTSVKISGGIEEEIKAIERLKEKYGEDDYFKIAKGEDLK